MNSDLYMIMIIFVCDLEYSFVTMAKRERNMMQIYARGELVLMQIYAGELILM